MGDEDSDTILPTAVITHPDSPTSRETHTHKHTLHPQPKTGFLLISCVWGGEQQQQKEYERIKEKEENSTLFR
jgi:hypothetical protein